MTRGERRMFVGIWIATLLVLGLVWAVWAEAYTCNASGCTWTSTYTEPTTLTNGQPLTDLANCTATYGIAVDGGGAGPLKTFSIPASKPSGGGVISKTFTDASLLPPHTYLLSEFVTCTSTAFGTGAPSNTVALPMNSGVAPSGTSSLTLQ